MDLQQILQQPFLGENALVVWLRGLALFFIVLFGLMFVRRTLLKRVARLAKLTSTDLDDLLIELLSQTKFLFILAMALSAASTLLQKSEQFERGIHVFFIASLFIQAVIWVNGFITYLVNRIAAKHTGGAGNVAIVKALGTVARFVVFLALFLFALNSIVPITPLLTGLGIGGIAVALAVQNVLSDLFAAVSILIDKPFEVGDFVVVDELKGSVEHIGLKTTRIRSLGGEQIVFSNADLLQSRIRNFKRMQERRIAFTTGVTYQTDYDKLKRVPEMIREIVESQTNVRFERCHFLKFADSWLEHETIYWVLGPDYMEYADIQHAINLALYRKFGEEGIDFAYPTRTVFVEKETDGAESESKPE